jgi:Transposase
VSTRRTAGASSGGRTRKPAVGNRWRTSGTPAMQTPPRSRACAARSKAARAPSDVLAWLATTPREWRAQIRYVAIDMFVGYRAAIRTGLSHATIVVDHFHVVQLADKMLNIVRHHGRATGPARPGRRPGAKAERQLLRNRENLTDAQFHGRTDHVRGLSFGLIHLRSGPSRDPFIRRSTAGQDIPVRRRAPTRPVGKRAQGNLSRVRISYPPPVPHRAHRRSRSQRPCPSSLWQLHGDQGHAVAAEFRHVVDVGCQQNDRALLS